MDVISLQGILEAFNAPINEEQSWAVCYQCASFFQSEWERSHCFTFSGLQSVQLSKDGIVTKVNPSSDSKLARTEYELVQCLGVLIFQALDYGLSETEEQTISPHLENLIESMTSSGSHAGHNGGGGEDADEGIEDATEEDDEAHSHRISFAHVMKACCDHLQSQVEPSSHYKAVCRALVAEAIELITFLEKISTDKEKLKCSEEDTDGTTLEELQKADWARIWMQVMRELRTGVTLKKRDCVRLDPGEYELTPYEILMKDIRDKKHNLKHIAVNGDIPHRTKKDAHDIILEFIRSRPPLHPAKDRRLRESPARALDAREKLLQDIRKAPKLKTTSDNLREVETSRTKLSEEGVPLPPKKVIKADLNLLDFDDDNSDIDIWSEEELEDRNKVSPNPFSPITPLSPHGKSPPTNGVSWQQTVVEDMLKAPRKPPVRRHSISVCQTPRKPKHAKRSIQSSLECLSLTVEEVMHIRNVLTKSELESLLVHKELHDQVSKGKVCFTCLKTKFSLFGPWSTKCKFCQRNVCSRCVSKMRIPTEHFENIPVYTLSPSPVTQESATDLHIYEKTGSAPNSPELPRRRFNFPSNSPSCSSTSSKDSTPVITNNNNSISKHTRFSTSPSATSTSRGNSSDASPNGLGIKARKRVARSATVRQPATEKPALQGPIMSICKDCRSMVLNIIKGSRMSFTVAPSVSRMSTAGVTARRKFGTLPKSAVSRHKSNEEGKSTQELTRPKREFHLDLKPVYKAK